MKEGVYFFLILFLTWSFLNFPLDKEHWISGLVLAALLSLLFQGRFSRLRIKMSLRRLAFAFVYLFVLLEEIIKANLDVAWRLLHPKMPIKPGIVEIKTALKSDFAKVVLANSITLTPGTLTLDILGQSLIVHWINVRTENKEEAARMIAGRFEKLLKLIFE